MSSNNYLLIKEYRRNRFSISDLDIENNAGFSVNQLVIIKSLREAIKMAENYLKKNIVEYGIRFKLIKK